MKVYLNDKEVELAANANLNSLLKEMEIESTVGVALALNNQVIRKEKWDETILQENDKILIIRASQGG